MKHLRFITTLSLVFVACAPVTQPPFSPSPMPSAQPTLMPSPSNSPTASPTSEPTSSPSPQPSATPSFPMGPVELYKGYMNEDTQNRYLNFFYAQKDGQGLALWYNSPQAGGQGGVRVHNFQTGAALTGLPDFGPAVAQLDAAGNGLLAWHSALPANVLMEEPTQYLYTQPLVNFQPSGSAQRAGIFQPLAVSLDGTGNGWLLFTDKRPPVYGDKQTTATQYPEVLHVQARQVVGYQPQAKTEAIFEIPYVGTMNEGYLDAQGNGFVVWTAANTGLGYRLFMQAFENLKPSGPALELANQAKNQQWLVQREGEGALVWLEYEATDTPQTLHIRPLQQGKLATTSQRLQVTRDIGQSLQVGLFAIHINAQGNGLLIWQQGPNQLMNQQIRTFALTGNPYPVVSEPALALQIKLSLDAQGNGMAAWVEKTGCEPGVVCTATPILRSRAVSNYQIQ